MARRPARLTDQIEIIRRYLPTARANFNRAYRESFTTRRRACPFVSELQYRRFKDASRLLTLTELCLKELRHQRAILLSPFKPGDQIRVCFTMKGYERAPQRYVVIDVEWRKGDNYIYIAHELTKRGRLHRGRYPTWVCPSSYISIESCAEPLDSETIPVAESARERAKARRSEAVENGRLALFDHEIRDR